MPVEHNTQNSLCFGFLLRILEVTIGSKLCGKKERKKEVILPSI
jgi:hypothetical protein